VRFTSIFNKLLNLQEVRVEQVTFEEDTIIIAVTPTRRKHHCPSCAFSCWGRYDAQERRWRHLALGCWRVELSYRLCRLRCPEHGVVTEAVPWAVPHARFTRDFEDLVAWLARTMDKTAVTRLLHISWYTVGNIIERVVQRTLKPERLNDLFVIGLDEVSYRKGHKYLTVIADHLAGVPVFITPGRTKAAVGEFFDALGPERAAEIAVVTMDMAAPFIEEVQARAPNAEIAFDPFHVVKMANEAVQEVRRSEVRKGLPEAQVLKDTRWSLLKAPESLTHTEQLRLSEVAVLNRPVYRAYLLKEELRALYCCTAEASEEHLKAWLSWASRSQLPPFVRLAKTLRGYRDGVLAAIRLGVSNGRLEGINNKIGVIKRRAFGFHSAAALISMIFLCCANLPINLPI
jgi:transposase